MKLNFKFTNLCGAVYKEGNVIFSKDGDCVFSPVGNRITQFDLNNNKATTFPFENAKNIRTVGVSPDGVLMITVDKDGHSLLISLHKQVVLHSFNFKKTVYDLKFSPDGKYFAVTHGNKVQVWHVPGAVKTFAPFVLYREYPGQYDEAMCIDWTEDSRFFAVGSRDMSCRIFSLHPMPGFHFVTLAGHRSRVVMCAFKHHSLDLYTVSKDGAVVVWECSHTLKELEDRVTMTTHPNVDKQKKVKTADGSSEVIDAATSEGSLEQDHTEVVLMNNEMPSSPEEDEGDEDGLVLPPRKRDLNLCLWEKKQKFLFNQEYSSVSCACYHKPRNLLVVGFSSGVFTLHEMPDFNLIHTLSVAQEKVTTVTASPSGEWLAFGCRSHGQLLVWEWASETYVLRQQGHYYDMNCMSYSPDGHIVVTGGDDGKVKLWNTSSSFCYITFSEHSGPVTDVSFSSSGHVVVSASLDGTVRAFDMNRYRNFRTFTSPRPVQFACVTLDPGGDVVCAATRDTYEIYMWSMQRGVLLEVLVGHEAPISSLRFNPLKSQLLSCGWDKTLRVWSVFTKRGGCERVQLTADALVVAPRPDGEGLAVATLDGLISLWDARIVQIGTIEGRRDLEVGRRVDDKVTAKKLSGGVAFYSLCYSADCSCLLAAGRSKFICIYSCQHQVLLKKFLITRNRSFDGMRRYLNNASFTEAGPLEMVSEDGDSEEDEPVKLPGVVKGDLSSRRTRPVISVRALQFSPTGDSFAAVSTEGLLIYSMDSGAMFTPHDLTVDVTPEAVLAARRDKDYLLSIVLSFRLNDNLLVRESLEAVPITDVPLLAANFPRPYLGKMMDVLSAGLEESAHLQFYLSWSKELLTHHGTWLKDNSRSLLTSLTALQKSLALKEKGFCKLVEDNTFFLEYLTDV